MNTFLSAPNASNGGPAKTLSPSSRTTRAAAQSPRWSKKCPKNEVTNLQPFPSDEETEEDVTTTPNRTLRFSSEATKRPSKEQEKDFHPKLEKRKRISDVSAIAEKAEPKLKQSTFKPENIEKRHTKKETEQQAKKELRDKKKENKIEKRSYVQIEALQLRLSQKLADEAKMINAQKLIQSELNAEVQKRKQLQKDHASALIQQKALMTSNLRATLATEKLKCEAEKKEASARTKQKCNELSVKEAHFTDQIELLNTKLMVCEQEAVKIKQAAKQKHAKRIEKLRRTHEDSLKRMTSAKDAQEESSKKIQHDTEESLKKMQQANEESLKKMRQANEESLQSMQHAHEEKVKSMKNSHEEESHLFKKDQKKKRKELEKVIEELKRKVKKHKQRSMMFSRTDQTYERERINVRKKRDVPKQEKVFEKLLCGLRLMGFLDSFRKNCVTTVPNLRRLSDSHLKLITDNEGNGLNETQIISIMGFLADFDDEQ